MPRYAYYLFKSQSAPDYKVPGIQTGPMLYVTHELTQISGSDVVIFSNCEEVRLPLAGQGPRHPEAVNGIPASAAPAVYFHQRL